jgi:hypothetical protein
VHLRQVFARSGPIDHEDAQAGPVIPCRQRPSPERTTDRITRTWQTEGTAGGTADQPVLGCGDTDTMSELSGYV